jgi:hypothetical protein
MKGRHDDHHSEIQLNEPQHEGLICAIQQNDTWLTTLNITALCHYSECHIFYCYAECHYAECHYANCGYAKCRYAECRNVECLSANEGTQYTNKPVRWNE